MIGRTVGSYTIREKLGEGGMGEVYLAEHQLMDRRAVIKVLRSHLGDREDMVRRFFNEARAAASIHHPGIVDVVDVGHLDDGRAFLMMDYLEGQSLAARIAGGAAGDTGFAVSVIRQVLGALAAAHQQGIVHRDLKPDNVHIVADPEVPGGERAVLLDFGIAKLVPEDGAKATATGATMGTPVYMAPEQCRGAGRVDLRADLYAVGCILFELLAGRPPFVAEGAGDLIAMHITEAPESVRTYNPAVPGDLEAIAMRLLEKDPDRRYRSAEEIIAALDAATDGRYASSPEAARPLLAAGPTRELGTAATVASRPPARNRRWLWAAPLVLVMVAGGVYYLAVGSSSRGTKTWATGETASDTVAAAEPAAAEPPAKSKDAESADTASEPEGGAGDSGSAGESGSGDGKSSGQQVVAMADPPGGEPRSGRNKSARRKGGDSPPAGRQTVPGGDAQGGDVGEGEGTIGSGSGQEIGTGALSGAGDEPGGVRAAKIRGKIERRVRRCAAAAGQPAGDVEVTLRVTPAGSAESAEVSEGSPRFRKCVRVALRRMSYPRLRAARTFVLTVPIGAGE